MAMIRQFPPRLTDLGTEIILLSACLLVPLSIGSTGKKDVTLSVASNRKGVARGSTISQGPLPIIMPGIASPCTRTMHRGSYETPSTTIVTPAYLIVPRTSIYKVLLCLDLLHVTELA